MSGPANLVHETSSTTGTGNLTLAAVNGKQSFATAFSTGVTTDVFVYFISNRDAAEYERGTGHMSDATTLVRDTVIESTNANAAVSFSAGTKDVVYDIPAAVQVQSSQVHHICNGRLTLESGVAVSTTDQTAKTTLYFTPYGGNIISLYDGTRYWVMRDFSEISITLASLTADLPYDAFVYDNSGTVTLELTAWTSATARATALTTQNGTYVKSGATTRRYVGTICITGTTGQCEDSLTKRLVWNMYNRVNRPMFVTDTTNSWTYSTQTWRQMNNSTSNQFLVVRGLDEDSMRVTSAIAAASSTSTGRTVRTAIGLDSTTAPAANCSMGFSQVSSAIISSPATEWVGYAGIGRHYLAALEWGEGTDTQTFYGQSGSSPEVRRNGIFAEVRA